MDWHLLGKFSILKKPTLEHQVLRSRLHFRAKIVYYFAMAFNSVARFLWIIRLWSFGTLLSERVDLSLQLTEIIRRWVWTILRLERQWTVTKNYLAVDSASDSISDLE